MDSVSESVRQIEHYEQTILLAFQPVFVAVFLDNQIVGGLNAVLLFQYDQTTGLMPVVGHARHEISEDAVFFC